jgi:hypothetical protein
MIIEGYTEEKPSSDKNKLEREVNGVKDKFQKDFITKIVS